MRFVLREQRRWLKRRLILKRAKPSYVRMVHVCCATPSRRNRRSRQAGVAVVVGEVGVVGERARNSPLLLGCCDLKSTSRSRGLDKQEKARLSLQKSE